MRNFVFNKQAEFWDPLIEYTDEHIDLASYGSLNLPRKGYVIRVASFFLRLWRVAVERRSRCKRVPNKTGHSRVIWVVADSNTELEALRFVEKLDKCNVVKIGVDGHRLIEISALVLGLMCSPYVALMIVASPPEKRRLTPYILDSMLRCTGYRLVSLVFAVFKRPDTILFSNHVSPLCRTVLSVTKTFGPKVIYCEHVPFLPYWPPLDVDFCLLSGEFSAKNMSVRTRESKVRVFGVGPARPAGLVNASTFSQRNHFNHVGIAIAPLDSVEVTLDFINKLVSVSESIIISVRAHPALRLDEWKRALRRLEGRVLIHSAKTRSLKSFLSEVDVLIVNDSGIYFDALLTSTPLIRMRLSYAASNAYAVPDHYHQYHSDTELVIQKLKCGRSAIPRFEFYKELFTTFGTEFWLCNEDLKCSLVSNILHTGDVAKFSHLELAVL